MKKNGKVVELGDGFWKARYYELKELIVELEVKTELSAMDLMQDLAGIDQRKKEVRRRVAAQVALELLKPAASRTTEVRTESNSLVLTTSILLVPAAVRDKFERMP